jgi:hypothetical protein
MWVEVLTNCAESLIYCPSKCFFVCVHIIIPHLITYFYFPFSPWAVIAILRCTKAHGLLEGVVSDSFEGTPILILWYFNPSVILPLFVFSIWSPHFSSNFSCLQTLYMLVHIDFVWCALVKFRLVKHGIRCCLAAWRLFNMLQISLSNLICTNPNLFHNLAGWAYLQGLPCAASNTS